VKKTVNKSRGVVKGAPSGLVISILIHAAAFLLAGMLVVFNVVKKEEKQFVPPKPVERPKMKLKKPKVKIKKSSKPKPTTRIVTKMNKASMPDIQLPEMTGLGDGLGGDVGGFDLVPNLGNDITVFGGSQSVGNDFVGTFYDMKRSRSGRNIPMGWNQFEGVLGKFIRADWNPAKFSRYYHSPNKLYTTSFMIPTTLSVLGPEAFGESSIVGDPDAVGGYYWCAIYKGQLVYHKDIKFRFWGSGDDVLMVRVNGKIVLEANWEDFITGNNHSEIEAAASWQSSAADSRQYFMGLMKAEVGDWIELKEGEPMDMEVLISEIPGGGFGAMLCVEEEGVDYPRKSDGGPTLPMFKTAEPSLDLIDAVYWWLIPGEASVTNGPVFCDYELGPRIIDLNPEEGEPIRFLSDEVAQIRTWTMKNGKTLEALLVSKIGDQVVLKNKRGRQKKVPWTMLSEADHEYVVLSNPPRFKIDFIKSSKPQFFIESPDISGWTPDQLDYTFGVRVKQDGAGSYNQELRVEFFAFADELEGGNHVLLDRQESFFTPTKENGLSCQFYGEKSIPVREIDTGWSDGTIFGRRGVKYGGKLVVISDKYGRIVDYSASNNWMIGALPRLRVLAVGKHCDKEGKRVFPPRQIIPIPAWLSY